MFLTALQKCRGIPAFFGDSWLVLPSISCFFDFFGGKTAVLFRQDQWCRSVFYFRSSRNTAISRSSSRFRLNKLKLTRTAPSGGVPNVRCPSAEQ